jgi:endogenous inhibitor of DNA gyrase (YacG/DUF329 family)
MQEDILGTQRTIAPEQIVVQCSRCGAMIPRSAAHLVASTTFSQTHSDFEYLCPDCQQALVAGEQDLDADL